MAGDIDPVHDAQRAEFDEPFKMLLVFNGRILQPRHAKSRVFTHEVETLVAQLDAVAPHG